MACVNPTGKNLKKRFCIKINFKYSKWKVFRSTQNIGFWKIIVLNSKK